MAADWGLLAKSAVGAAIAATTAVFFPEALPTVAAGSTALSTLTGDLTERTINRLRAPRPPEQSPFDRAADAALAAIAMAAGENNIDDAQAERLTQALAPLLSDVNLSAERLTAAGFDAGRLADAIIDSRPRLCAALSVAEITLARRLLTAGVAAALAQPEFLTASEAAFRAAVLANLGDILTLLKQLPEDAAKTYAAFFRNAAAKAVLAPNAPSPYIPGKESTPYLLSADFELTPLIGRDGELVELRQWCDEPAIFDIRVYTGAGGIGKTRLFRALSREMESAGWIAGFITSPVNDAHAGMLIDAVIEAGRAALVIDYADRSVNAPAIELALRIARTAAARNARVRVVLISRTHTEWWGELRQKLQDSERSLLVKGIENTPARPVAALSDIEDRRALFQQAAHALSARLGKPVPAKLGDFDLSGREFDQPLTLLMAALALVEQPDGPPLRGRIAYLDWVLDRQRRLWNAALGEKYADLSKACAQTVAVAHMRQGVPDRDAAVALLRKIPALEGLQTDPNRRKIIEVLRAQHPGDHYLNGLFPDAIGHRLATLEQGDEIGLVELGADMSWESALTTLNHGVQDDPSLRGALFNALAANLDKADEAAMEVAIRTGDPIGKVLAEIVAQRPDPERARRLLRRIPERTTSLRELAEVTTRQALEGAEKTDAVSVDGLVERAKLLNDLSVRLSALGRREEALQAIVEAAEIYRHLADQRPDAFKPDLAASLNNLSACFSDLGRREDALQAITEAVNIRRQLAKQRPDAFWPNLALSLNNLSAFLSGLGRREEALQAILEAAEIYRQLAEQRPNAFLPNLALSLNNLSSDLSDLGRREEALQAVMEAVELHRQLADQRPDAFKPDLALSLNNLSLRLPALGRREEALQAILEAVEIYRQLAEQRPDAFKPDLATSLNNLANHLSDLGRREKALEAILEAVSIRRQLADQRPDVFTVDLARSLGAQGSILQRAARTVEAAAAFAEGLRLILPYARRYGPALAGLTSALYQDWLKTEPEPDEALVDEAIDFLRPFLPPTDGAEG